MYKCANKSNGCSEQLPHHQISVELTVSVIFSNHVPAGSSPHVWTDMKSQFLKPLADVSLSRSASSTVLVPEGIYKGIDQSRTCLFHSDVSVFVCVRARLLPDGEVRVMCRSPLLVYSMLASTCTCSNERTAFSCPAQALVGISIVISPAAFSSLRSSLK